MIAPGHLALNELIGDDPACASPPRTCSTATTGSRTSRSRCRCRRTYVAALRHPSEAHVDGIADALTRLAHDDALYERLAAGALARVTDSMERRRAQLARIYGAAIS